MPDHALVGSRPEFCPQALRRFGVGSTAGLLLTVCLFLAGRRAGGAFDQPLSPPILLLLGIGIAILASCLRTVWPRGVWWPMVTRQSHADRRPRGSWRPNGTQRPNAAQGINSVSFWARLILPSVALVLFCYALSVPGSAPWSVAVLWFLVVSEEGAWWLVEGLAWRTVRRPASLAAPTAPADPSTDSRPVHAATDLDLPDEDEVAGLVMQQMTRLRDEDGSELVFGQASAEFVSGERSQSIHLAFCPPLIGNPQITALHAGGHSAAITVAQAEPFGARLDVRLAATARQPERVTVEFEARGPAANEPGAPDS